SGPPEALEAGLRSQPGCLGQKGRRVVENARTMGRLHHVVAGKPDIIELAIVKVVQSAGSPSVTQNTPDGLHVTCAQKQDATGGSPILDEVEFSSLCRRAHGPVPFRWHE